ncbi:DUF4179 domain-containing protein [Brevibacillus sp. B_LB10_24]|uniref:DUF4179 domain-containing protein n=1 Tax=Brevibacillus sp. B_LB10_24 TaxID=3380645 RepID=UPI0038BD0464
MKCNKSKQLIDYMENGLSTSESSRLEKHLEDCPDCQEQWEQLMDHMDDFEFGIDLPGQEVPGETFKQGILARVDPYVPISEMKTIRPHKKPPKTINWKKRSVVIVKKMSIVAAGLTIAVTLGTFVSPSFAAYVKSLFNTMEKADPGMKQAVVQGLVQPLDLKATDQGITVTVKEVLADTMRIAIICDARDSEGKMIDLSEDSDIQFVITDKAGTQLFDPKEMGWNFGKSGDYLMANRELTEVITGEKTLPDELVVQVSSTEITGKKGNWQVSVPVDMAKAKTATKSVAINKQYTSPQGLIIDLKRADFSPSATLLTLETKLTPEVQAQKKELIDKNESTQPYWFAHEIQGYEMAYELVDEAGNVVAAWDDLPVKELSIMKNEINNGRYGRENESGTTWWHSFVPMTDKQKLTFKLHSIYTKELSGINIKINANDLKNKPIDIEAKDNHFTLKNMRLTERTYGPNTMKVGLIDIEGTLAHDIVQTKFWTAKDETGKEYQVSLNEKTTAKDGKIHISGELVIKNLEVQPNELTFSIGILTKQHRDVNWEVPIEISQQK